MLVGMKNEILNGIKKLPFYGSFQILMIHKRDIYVCTKPERDSPQEKCWVSIVTKRYSCTGDRKETHKKHKNLRIFFGDAKHVRLCDGVVCAGMQSEMNPD
jgi:hypothetical protein